MPYRVFRVVHRSTARSISFPVQKVLDRHVVPTVFAFLSQVSPRREQFLGGSFLLSLTP